MACDAATGVAAWRSDASSAFGPPWPAAHGLAGAASDSDGVGWHPTPVAPRQGLLLTENPQDATELLLCTHKDRATHFTT